MEYPTPLNPQIEDWAPGRASAWTGAFLLAQSRLLFLLISVKMLSRAQWAMVVGTRQLTRGSELIMAGKSPRGGALKKQPKTSLKEKRAAKREKMEDTFLKPRKGQ